MSSGAGEPPGEGPGEGPVHGPDHQPDRQPDQGPDRETDQPPTKRARRRLGKRGAALVVLLPAVVLLGLATRPWASGRARDVLTSGVTEVTGSTAAPGMVAVALVTIVALLGMMTGGRVIRALSAGVLVIAALGTLALTVAVALQPVQAVAEAVARQLARTTAPETVASTTAWAWLAVVVATLLAAGAVAASVSSRSWAGLSSRYERGAPTGAGTPGKPGEPGPRGQVRTPWDELSEGGDPTLRDGPDPT